MITHILCMLSAVAGSQDPWADGTLIGVDADNNVVVFTEEDPPQQGVSVGQDGRRTRVWTARPIPPQPPTAPEPPRPPLPYYLGVKMVPVPAAVAAQVGEDGLMIVNVVVGSPADEAGLERYDIIRGYDDQQIVGNADLYDALEGSEAGDTVLLRVLRGGETLEFEVPLAMRPDEPPVLKYEELAGQTADRSVTYFGHKLKRKPGGGFTLEPLGQLKFLPQDLTELFPDVPRAVPWQSPQLRPAPPRWNLDIQLPDDVYTLDDRAYQFNVTVEDDGARTTVSRDADGVYTVERKSPDGDVSVEKYETMEQLRSADPEAADMISGMSVQRPPIEIRRLFEDREQLQREYQDQVERALEQRHALEEHQAAMEKARRALDELRAAREKRGSDAPKSARWSQEGRDSEPTTEIFVAADGEIRVTLRRGGDVQRYRFADRETFEREAPRLYEKFKDMLE